MHSTAIVTNSVSAFVKAARPQTLGAMSCPILIGTACAKAAGPLSLSIFTLSLGAGLLLQILANFINDYGDFIKGSDAQGRLGPPRALQMGWITKNAMMQGMGLTTVLIILCGWPLVLRGGLPILFMGMAGLFLCAWYTLGKRPLAYIGFAEVIIFFVFGPGATIATYYLQTKAFSMPALIASLSPGFLASALLLTNNLRDLEQDRINNKRTTAVRLGENFCRNATVILVILALLGPLILWSCIAFLLPARYFTMILREPISSKFNLMLAGLGRALYLLAIIFSLGIVYGAP